MKFKPCFLFILSVTVFACQNQQKKRFKSAADSIRHAKLLAEERGEETPDPRPKDEAAFFKRIAAESDYDVTSNAAKKDAHIIAFNKYALDSLKSIKDWEFKVTEVNDNSSDASSLVKTMGNPDAVYNLILVAPIKVDNSVDSISISNRVDFVYSIPKEPKGDALKKQLDLIKTLTKNDVVIVSGALTHIDDKGKVNFASFYDQYLPWNIDLLLTSIRKK
ncbi:hypothetical protein [Mucilaginibacter dorajii]|uniref:Lipoprotein n=1 Tax=Mucilaginibacter dorajii TaxID=692994 RepID=A0ABP7R9T4_9SPHI|nr:hypothetical protein [Mucilaginibacter dorajii]MCS3736751.1 hypothetical protein [Mucilaginibacter dorajii]